MNFATPAIEQTWHHWHQFTEKHDLALLDQMLAEEVVFHSPVVWTPQKGKSITKLYLSGAGQVLERFQYVRKVVDGRDWVLEFSAQVGDIHVKGVDIIQLNDQGQIIDFEVMVRPLKAINALHQAMAQMLEMLKKQMPT